METTWNDNDCCLNIVIGPEVVDTTFNNFVSKFGTRNSILHDQGKEFKNAISDELEKHFLERKCHSKQHSLMQYVMERWRLNSTVLQTKLNEKIP